MEITETIKQDASDAVFFTACCCLNCAMEPHNTCYLLRRRRQTRAQRNVFLCSRSITARTLARTHTSERACVNKLSPLYSSAARHLETAVWTGECTTTARSQQPPNSEWIVNCAAAAASSLEHILRKTTRLEIGRCVRLVLLAIYSLSIYMR